MSEAIKTGSSDDEHSCNAVPSATMCTHDKHSYKTLPDITVCLYEFQNFAVTVNA